MKDKNLEKNLLTKLSKLEEKVDWMADTPKRHKISELIGEIRKLVKEPPTPGYE